jgi:spermidine/putrescine transport system substrate-binding protein
MHSDEEVAKFTETAKRVFKGAKLVGDIATMNQALVAGEIDFHLTGGTYSASPARADGHPEFRGITPKIGPMAGGKGGIAWIEITSTWSTTRNCRRWPRTSSPMSRLRMWPTPWPLPKVPSTRSTDGQSGLLQALHQGTARCHPVGFSLAEEMARSAEYDIVPDYDKLLDIMTAAKREASGG